MKTTPGSTTVEFLLMKQSRVLAALLLCALLTACPNTRTTTIVIRGSNTIGEDLVPRLAGEFRRENHGVAFDMEFKGSSYGLGALMAARCDIAASSRELALNEPALARERGVELAEVVLGSYAVAVILHANNPLTDLTRDQVRDIFTGALTNWQALGGPDAPIQTFIRDQISGTHLGFQELAMEKKPYAINARPMTNYANIAQAIGQNPHAIGYASFDFIGKPGLKAVEISGAAPTAGSVHQGKYPYCRTLRLITDKAHERDVTRRFVEFAVSPQGRKIVEQMGNIPPP